MNNKQYLRDLRLKRDNLVIKRANEDNKGCFTSQIEALDYRIDRIEQGACPSCLGPKHKGDCPTL